MAESFGHGKIWQRTCDNLVSRACPFEREKALASAGHVSGVNISGNVGMLFFKNNGRENFCNPLFFPPIPFSKGKAQQTRLELRSRAENGMLLTAAEAARIGALQPKL